MKKALLQLHLAVFLAGFTAILGKLIGLNEVLLVGYRLLLTVLTLGVLLYYRKEMLRLSFTEASKLLGVGAIVALHWVTFYGSIRYGNVSIALVCLSAAGFFTALLEPLIVRRAFSVSEVLLGLVAVAGIYVIFDFHPQYTVGIIFGMISALGSSLFPIFNKQLTQRHSPGLLTFYELGGGLLVLTLATPLYLKAYPATYLLPTWSDVFWLCLLAWVCTVYSFGLQLKALRVLSAFTANLAYNLEPVYGILLAFWLFGENRELNAHFYGGVALILLSVLLQTIRVFWQRRREKRQSLEVAVK